ncbi:MAG: HAD-IA family hydrolase [Nitrospirota bacterium]
MHIPVHDIKNALATHDITHVLLDMDGTLLDKYFDDYFWEHLVPEKYADKHRVSFGKAKEELLAKYKSHEETLNWTDIDFWSAELGLDILALKEQIRHVIEVHPHVEGFLQQMRSRGKKVYIATNAHDKVLALKLKKTEIGKYLTGAITSAEMGFPKEKLEFWKRAEKKIGFHRESALFVDDTLAVLRTAKLYGIRYIVYKAKGNSKVPPGHSPDFATVMDFNELM